jgi:hypothetical protein
MTVIISFSDATGASSSEVTDAVSNLRFIKFYRPMSFPLLYNFPPVSLFHHCIIFRQCHST